jgi:hypothetical protein
MQHSPVAARTPQKYEFMLPLAAARAGTGNVGVKHGLVHGGVFTTHTVAKPVPMRPLRAALNIV